MTWEHADLEAVIDSASRGDTAALDELLRRYRPRLIRMIRYRLDPRLHPRVDESDVLQETLIATSGAIRNYVADDCGPFYAWLRRIAWRQLRRLCRQHIETGKRSVDREEFALTNDSRDALCQQLISLSTPSRAAQQAETEQQMYAALDKLAEPDREILVLRYLEQLDSQEIAGVLRTSESTVRMRLMHSATHSRITQHSGVPAMIKANDLTSPGCDDEMGLANLVELASRQLAAGEEVDLHALCREHPEYADELAKLLPTVRAMATIGCTESKISSAAEPDDMNLAGEEPLGDFRLVREIGRGGMGVVYEAKQRSLPRRVALKVLPFAALLDRRQLQRFQNEARAAATLDHPGIVSIYSVGCERSVHFYAMQLVEGQSLAEVIRELRQRTDANPLDETVDQATSEDDDQVRENASACEAERVGGKKSQAAETRRIAQAAISTDPATGKSDFRRSAVRLGIQTAEALQYAHTHSVLHRDVKPSNLMLDAEGRVTITDFGLARIQTDPGMTATGDLVGTLRYMSPEQADGRFVDERTDVYSLGVTLYELLTLRPPFQAEQRQELLRQIANEDPLPPRRLTPHLPLDLETIVLKALEKRPEERYESAQTLADDLKRFLEGQPILAKPPSMLDRVAKWMRRRRGAAAAVLAALAVAVVCLATTTVIVSGALQRTRHARAQAISERDAAIYNQYVANVRLAKEEWDNGNLDVVHTLLDAHVPATGRPDLRGWEWHYLESLFHRDVGTLGAHLKPVNAVAWSPDGRQLLTASEDCTLKIWDAATQRQVRTLRGHDALIWSAEWSPDGPWVASASWDKTVRIWDATTGETTQKLAAGTSAMRDVAWSPDGAKLATCGDDSLVRIWDARTGGRLLELKGHPGVVWSVDWSPDGAGLASVGNYEKRDIRIWNAVTGEQVKEIVNAHHQAILWVSWSPDSQRLATASGDQRVKVWDVDTGKRLWQADAQNAARSVSWSPDGQTLASGGVDAAVRLWDPNDGKLLRILRGHTAGIRSVDWRPDGKRLLSGSADGTVKVWDPDQDQMSTRVEGLGEADWSPDGRYFAVKARRDSTHANPGIEIVDAATTVIVDRYPILLPEDGEMEAVAWSPDGKRIAYGVTLDNGRSTVDILEHPGGAKLATLSVPEPETGRAACIAWSPDGDYLAAGTFYQVATDPDFQKVVVWNTLTGNQVASLSHDAWEVAWSPDGARLATSCAKQLVRIWDTATWRQLLELDLDPAYPELAEHPGGSPGVAWSVDSQTLVAMSTSSGYAVFWDVTTGREKLSFPAHAGGESISISPDQRRIGTCGSDRSLRIWDAATGAHLLTLDSTRALRSIKWSPDGMRLLTSGGGIQVWGASPIGEPQ